MTPTPHVDRGKLDIWQLFIQVVVTNQHSVKLPANLCRPTHMHGADIIYLWITSWERGSVVSLHEMKCQILDDWLRFPVRYPTAVAGRANVQEWTESSSFCASAFLA